MKEIPLTRGKVAIVDDEDFERLSKFKRKRYLGTFKTLIEAARAYNRGAMQHYGEFARLNSVESEG